tara:strand:- start:2237 stop:2746 length:510 start_codon:yes stop_codon:yes gene_type:complete
MGQELNYSNYISALKGFEAYLKDNIADFLVSELVPIAQKPLICDWNYWSDEGKLAIPEPGTPEHSKSGVYFFVRENGETIYIGKASKDNSHHRIWSHLGVPVKSINSSHIFPNSRFINCSSETTKHEVTKGLLRVGFVEVKPSNATSLVEVFLQTLELPVLCKRLANSR